MIRRTCPSLSIERLSALIELIALYLPRGLRVLLGVEEPPTPDELTDLLKALRSRPQLSVRIIGGQVTSEAEARVLLAEKVDEIAAEGGGWPNIARAAKLVSEYHPTQWRRFEDTILHPASLDVIALRHRMSTRGLIKSNKSVCDKIAITAALRPPVPRQESAHAAPPKSRGSLKGSLKRSLTNE